MKKLGDLNGVLCVQVESTSSVISMLKFYLSRWESFIPLGQIFPLMGGYALYSKSRVQIVTAGWYNLYAIFSCSGCTQVAPYGSLVSHVGKNCTRMGALSVFIFS